MEFGFDSVNDLQKLCRLCMESGSELFSIYDLTPLNEIGVHIQFVEMIMGCTSLKIKSGDGLPEAICMQCVNYLGTSYNFKQRCEKTDRKLRDLINLLKDNKKSDISEQEDFNDSLSLDHFDIDIKEEINGIQDGKLEVIDLENNTINSKVEKDRNSISKITNSKEKQTDDKKSSLRKKGIPKREKIGRENRNLSCSFCFKQFRTENKLKSHTNICQNRPMHCGLCSEDFSDITILKQHLAQIHSIETDINEDQIYTCDICDSVFTDHSKLLFHYRNHIGVAAYYPDEVNSGDKVLTCSHCNTTFTKIFDLETHFNGHKSDKSTFICRICSYETIEEQSVKTHLKNHGIGPLICNICWLSFISNRKLRLHVKAHKQVNRLEYTCLLCEKMLPTRAEIKNHIAVHIEDLHSCSSCSKSFQNVTEYESHQMEHAKSVLCTICGKLFPGKSVLDSHMLIHDGLKPFSCSICKQSFRTKHILKGHERVHSDAKPYVCTWCGYCCKRSGDLYIHHRTHTGDRPYSCSFPGCNSTFKTSSFMHQHLKRHTGEAKMHTCEVCSKLFSSSIALKRHMLIHNNERPHACDVCGKCFRRKHHLKGHKAKIHHL